VTAENLARRTLPVTRVSLLVTTAFLTGVAAAALGT
jgi:hypothetical protein